MSWLIELYQWQWSLSPSVRPWEKSEVVLLSPLTIFLAGGLLCFFIKELCQKQKWHYRGFFFLCLTAIILSIFFGPLIFLTLLGLIVLICLIALLVLAGLGIKNFLFFLREIFTLIPDLRKPLLRLPGIVIQAPHSLKKKLEEILVKIRENPPININGDQT